MKKPNNDKMTVTFLAIGLMGVGIFTDTTPEKWNLTLCSIGLGFLALQLVLSIFLDSVYPDDEDEEEDGES